jgi:hypothetical protein
MMIQQVTSNASTGKYLLVSYLWKPAAISVTAAAAAAAANDDDDWQVYPCLDLYLIQQQYVETALYAFSLEYHRYTIYYTLLCILFIRHDII